LNERAVNVSLNYSRGVTARALQLPTSTTAEKLSTSASSLSHFVDRFFFFFPVIRTLNGSLNDLDKSSEVDGAPSRGIAFTIDRESARVSHHTDVAPIKRSMDRERPPVLTPPPPLPPLSLSLSLSVS